MSRKTSMDFELPQQDPCFFCDAIRKGEAQDFVYETDAILVRVNDRQFLEGQCVVIPRRHAPTLFDLTDAESTEIMEVAQRVGRAIAAAVDADGMLIYQNNGVASLQEVPHYHMHLVPQWKAGGPKNKLPPHISTIEGQEFERVEPIYLKDEALRRMTERIRTQLPAK